MRLTRNTILALFLYAALVPLHAYAAEITFSPSTLTKGVQEEFTVKVSVNPGGAGINAADGTISFDPALLSVASINRDGSAFSLWTAEPSFSNSAGTVVFSGGTPTAFSSTGTVLNIRFKAKAPGTATVSVSKGSILAADGKGTDVYKKGTDAVFTISNAAPPPPPPPPADEPEPEPASDSETSQILVPAPDVQSSTHKKAEQWYATSTLVVNWKVPTSMTSIRTGISQNKDDKPKKQSTPASQTERFENLTEGVWYFTAQFKDDFEWGPVAVREVRVDITPPDEYDIAILNSDTAPPRFAFGTTDVLSGMNRYELYLQGAIAATAKASELIENAYPIPPQAGGMQKVTIKAYDNAGNVREVEKQLELPFVDVPKPKGAEEETKESGFRIEWIVIALFAFIIGGLAAWQMQMRKTIQKEQTRILERVIQARERNDKVFAAMREEFEQLIHDFDVRPQLTPEERALLENLKEVLDVSEEIVDSDIEELKKLVKNMQ
jgi:hypothetical protein